MNLSLIFYPGKNTLQNRCILFYNKKKWASAELQICALVGTEVAVMRAVGKGMSNKLFRCINQSHTNTTAVTVYLANFTFKP